MNNLIEELTCVKENLICEIVELKKQRQILLSEHELLIGDINSIIPEVKHQDFAIIPESEIVRKSKGFRRIEGVYFLIKDDVIVYVGRSTNILTRINQHPKAWYNKATFIECSEAKMVEALYIHAYEPIHNARTGAGNKMTTNYSVDSLKRRASY